MSSSRTCRSAAVRCSRCSTSRPASHARPQDREASSSSTGSARTRTTTWSTASATNVGASPFAATAGIAGTLPSLSVLNTTNALVPVEARDGWESVIKGGAGLFYDLGTTIALLGYEGYPHRITVNYPNVAYPLATAPGVVEPAFRTTPPYSTAYGYVSDFVSPRTWQWNATFEQSLGSRQRVSIGYVGAAGRELTRTEAYTRPNPLFSDTVQLVRNAAVSDYRSLQVQYVQRLWRGLEGMAAYTWAHATDTASSGGVGTINVPRSTQLAVKLLF